MKKLLAVSFILLIANPVLGEISPENLKKYSPPKVDQSRLKKIESFLDLRSPSLGIMAKNGKDYYFNWKVTGISQVWKSNGSFPVQMTGGMHSTFLKDLTPDGKYILIFRDQNGEEKPGLYLQSTAGGELVKVFHQKGVKVRYSDITSDSKIIYFWANDIDADSFTLYRYFIEDKKQEQVFHRDGYWSLSDMSGDKLLLAKWRGHSVSEYYEYIPQKNQLTPLFGQGEEEEFTARYGQNGEILVLTNKFGEFNQIFKFSQDKFYPLLPANNFEITSMSINREKTRLLYSINEKGFYRFVAINLENFEKIDLPDFSSYVRSHYGATSGRYTTISLRTSSAPPMAYVYNWETKKLKKLTSPSTPEVDTNRFVDAKLEYFITRDGVKVPMLVRRPKRCEKELCPVVVNFHGGPESQTLPGFSPYRQIFLDKGFIFVDPNVRGSTGMGKSWAKSDDGIKRLDVITDIVDVADHIKKYWLVNGLVPKIGVMGGSYGGYATLYAMTRFAGTYDAGNSRVGMSNLKTFLENTSGYRRKLRISEYGNPATDQEFLKILSPTTYLDRIKSPILITHGVNDPRVPATESLQIQEMMEQKGIDGQLILFPDEGHGVRKRKNRALSWAYSLDFFEKHLK